MTDEDTTRRLGQLADDLGVGVVLMTASRISYANVSACELVGRTEAELMALPNGGTLVAPQDQPALAMLYGSGRQRPGVASLRLHVVHRNGELVPIDAVVRMSPRDGALDTLVLARDVRNEEAVRRELGAMVDLLDRVPVGVIVWERGAETTRDLRVQFANAAALRQLAFSELRGCRLDDVFPDADADSTERLYRLCGSERVESFPDVAFRGRQGKIGLYRWLGAGLPDGRVAAVFEDVTRQRANEASRRELLRRLVATIDRQREQLAIDIHDDVVQQLAAAATLVEGLRRSPTLPDAGERLDDAASAIRNTIASLRRLVFDLAPAADADADIDMTVALQSIAASLFPGGVPRVDIDVAAPGVSNQLKHLAIRIAAEALTNVYKHAQASTASVTVRADAGSLFLDITDDGRGVQPSSAKPGHLGQRSMRERASAAGGTCTTSAGPGGRGTTVSARIPLHPDFDPDVTTIALNDDSEIEEMRAQLAGVTAAAQDARREAQLATRRLEHAMALMRALGDPDTSTIAAARAAVELAGNALDAACAVHLLTDDGTTLARVASWHPDPEQLAALDAASFADRRADEGHARTVLQTHQPLVAADIDALEPAERARFRGCPIPVRSVMVLPLICNRRVLGTLAVLRDETTECLDEEDVEFAMCVATHLAIAVDRAAPGD